MAPHDSLWNGLVRAFGLFDEVLLIILLFTSNSQFDHYLHLFFVLGDGKCVICDSFVNPHTLVRICDECNYGSNENRCVVCGNVGVTDAYYCRECVQQGKHCEGCPKIVNLGSVRCDGNSTRNLLLVHHRMDWLIVMFDCVAKKLGIFLLYYYWQTKTDLFYERKKYGFKKR